MSIQSIKFSCDGSASASTLPNSEFFQIEKNLMLKLRKGEPKILDERVVVFICIAGRGKLIIDMHTAEIERGCLCVLLPYSVIQLIEYSDDINLTAITAGVHFLDTLSLLRPIENYIQLIGENPCLQLEDKEIAEFISINHLANLVLPDKTRPLANEIHDNLLMLFALQIVSLYAKNKPMEKRKHSRQEQILRDFIISLTKNFREHRDVGFYADKACLTPKYFTVIISEKTGKTPSQWILERTIILIKFMLENTELSILEISNDLNFPSQSAMGKYFKKTTGVSPKEYRKTYQTEV